MEYQNRHPKTEASRTNAPVVIAGAGPVGLSLALGLAHAGVKSIILEKNNGLEPYSRAILIPARTLDIFEGWGVLNAARRAGIYSPCLQAYDAGSGKVAMSIDFTDLKDLSANAGFLFLPQDRTEALLLASLQSTGACDLHFGTIVSGFSQDEHGVTIEATEGKASAKFYAPSILLAAMAVMASSVNSSGLNF